MALHASSSASIVKRRKPSSKSATKRYRFESFTDRIARLDIDPIRKRSIRAPRDKSKENITSCFATALYHWKQSNLSKEFRAFTAIVEPLCQSLPLLLHREGRIYDELSQSIRASDELALEPLLDLLVQFARDLGHKFEAHFSDAVLLIASLPGKHHNVDVIEWSFSCLSWQFKYLSRLLVPNLGPLYQTIAPLLGREPQKLFIIRFAAEAMSFLVRKAATTYEQNPHFLDSAIAAIKADFLDFARANPSSSRMEQYQYGIMSLLINAIKGVERKLHSGAIHLYHCLLKATSQEPSEPQHLVEILHGVTVAIVHHTDALGLAPLARYLTDKAKEYRETQTPNIPDTLARSLYLLVSVRKGSRISDWQAHFDACLNLLQVPSLAQPGQVPDSWKAACVLLHSAPDLYFDRNVEGILCIMRNGNHMGLFLTFCDYLHELNQERFDRVLLPQLSTFIAERWSLDTLWLLECLPRLFKDNADHKVPINHDGQDHILHLFESAMSIDENVVECFHTLNAIPYLCLPQDLIDRWMDSIGKYIDFCLENTEHMRNAEFAVGLCLQTYLEHSQCAASSITHWWPCIRRLGAEMADCSAYLESIVAIHMKCGSQFSDQDRSVLTNALRENLRSSSSKLRISSLETLEVLQHGVAPSATDLICSMLDIERTPISFESARVLAMRARKLGISYHHIVEDIGVKRLVPYFVFGMLTKQLEQARMEALDLLRSMCNGAVGEEIIKQLVFDWLQSAYPPLARQQVPDNKSSHSGFTLAHEFQCSNLSDLETKFAAKTLTSSAIMTRLEELYHNAARKDTRDVIGSRSLALNILTNMPILAEKNAEIFIPHFLSWAARGAIEHADEEIENQNLNVASPESNISLDWTISDRKAMLIIISRFQDPRRLKEGEAVFKALNNLLCSGDLEIQRLSTEAILAWRSPALIPYRSKILGLLDESQFRDEMMSLLGHSQDDKSVLEEHQQELIPIVLRILYGRMINRNKKAGSKGDRESKRKATFQALQGLEESSLGELISISLGSLDNMNPFDDSMWCTDRRLDAPNTARRQLGALKAIESLLEAMGGRLEFDAKRLLNFIVCSLARGSLSPKSAQSLELDIIKASSMDQAIRQVSLKCLISVARRFTPNNLGPYVPLIFSRLLSRRLPALPIESAQGVSGFLKLFSAWASSPESLAFLVGVDRQMIPSLASCLTAPHCKEEVKLFILDDIMLRALATCKEFGETSTDAETQTIATATVNDLLQQGSKTLLGPLSVLVQQTSNKSILGSSIKLIKLLSRMGPGECGNAHVIPVALSLLNQTAGKVNPEVKSELVQILEISFLDIEGGQSNDMYELAFGTLSSLFGYFKDMTSRQHLSNAFKSLAAVKDEIKDTAELCWKLNACSARSIGTPDYDVRLQAFNTLIEASWQDYSSKQCRPLMENMLYFLKDEEELAFRSSAALSLQKLIQGYAVGLGNGSTTLQDLVQNVLLPKLKRCPSEKSELVRQEHLNLLGLLLRLDPNCPGICDLQPLLAGGDEDASFFNNILHIQSHRRVRALRRLASMPTRVSFHSGNVSHFLIPLIEHYIFPKDNANVDHNLSGEAIKTIGCLSWSLQWSHFRAIFRRYASGLLHESERQKSIVKLLGVMIETLDQALAESKRDYLQEKIIDAPQDQEIGIAREICPLSRTVPKEDRLHGEVREFMLPILRDFIREKDENLVSLRIPVAVSAAKLLKLLPSTDLEQQLPPVLTDICNILRSKAQESRDLARKTLSEIATLVGPGYFTFLLQELRTALPRGSQLHVLSYTLHSILVHVASQFEVGDLDDSLDAIVNIIIDDTLGHIGQEKDAEEYNSKMKEVKSNKSYDSMELVARMTTVPHIMQILRPLQGKLAERMDLRAEKKVDELLRRVEVGITQNVGMQDQSILVFCYELMQEVSGASQSDTKPPSRRRELDHPRNLNKAQTKLPPGGSQSKFLAFSLNVLKHILSTHQSLRTPTNLHGFMPMIGEALIQPDESVQLAALRLLVVIIHVPLRTIDEQSGMYVAESVRIVRDSPSTSIEISQAAYKVASTILREKAGIDVRESDVAYLLRRLVPDLEQPSKHGSAFNFVRAVLRRRIVIPEVYEVADLAATIMVTNQTKGVRDTARETYVQFLLVYPQTRERFSKQLDFLTQNLHYTHSEGRQSVMEALSQIFAKTDADIGQQAMEQAFVPLVMMMINDDSKTCREMAGLLVKTIFNNASETLNHSLKALLRSWITQVENPVLRRVAFQIFGLLLDKIENFGKDDRNHLLRSILESLSFDDDEPSNVDWELLYQALQAFHKLCRLSPSEALDVSTSDIWACVQKCVAFPHQWVRLSATNLMGLLFADMAKSSSGREMSSVPVHGSGGMSLGGTDISKAAERFLTCIKDVQTGTDLADQAVRNLVFLGTLMLRTSLTIPLPRRRSYQRHAEDEGDSESEQALETSAIEETLAFTQLLYRCSKILRKPPSTMETQSLRPLRASLRLLAAMINVMTDSVLTENLVTLLIPLNNLTDSSIPAPVSVHADFKEGYDQIVTNAHELLEKVQHKAGAVEYVKALQSVRATAKRRREDRRSKRAIDRITDPVKAGRNKRKKGEKKKVRRKEKGNEYRSMRRGY